MLLLKAILLPPLCFFALAAFALLIRRRRKTLSRALMILSVIGLFASTLPITATCILGSLQSSNPSKTDPGFDSAEAILVLSADLQAIAPEYGRDTVSAQSLERTRYAAFLAKRTGKSICTSGGVIREGTRPLAELMAEVLENEFQVTVKWRESHSKTTWENAKFSSELLKAQGIQRIALVTHAWHMPRAIQALNHFGLEVIPAPTAFEGPLEFHWREFIPSARALAKTSLGVHEWIGRLFYVIKSAAS